ncbi:4-hydroxybenzoate octaprenyltransferase [Parahaliea sp. F7430]|uniref:4-hydroxybenzoate octaprenyltransferase n=1 Tax=Sediminihaliea albiluteola TaxID=2758564 RepID=A0A7W2TX79_9GAMM|nr:4-hydroxybenzoate octaprenyltransferase [Sediminihaliea albiluteola]MBA6413620.1 4-hydroxybenzoate octaprenyltransferase [Sediminihaliea albiluteola]
MTSVSKAQALLQLIRFDKPIGTLLLLWPTLWALWLAAAGLPDLDLLLIFCLGTFLMRSAGCIINDLADRHWDGGVQRTEQRPLVTGTVSVLEARIFFAVLCLAAFALVLLTNTFTVMLSFVAVALTATYPFMKRYTHWPQLVLGAAFSWGIPMAFAAQLGQLPAALWWVFAANLLWTIVFDTQYAMVDRDDDLKLGIKSTAVLFGRYDRAFIALFQAACLGCLVMVGRGFDLGGYYYAALLLVAAVFIYHQRLIYSQERAPCFKAFLHNTWVGALIFAGIALHFAVGQ